MSGGPLACSLDEEYELLATKKSNHVMKCYAGSQIWMDSLEGT